MDTEMPTGNAVTVIIGQKVRAGSEDAFEVWQQQMNTAASQYPGFLAAEITPPSVAQPEWLVVYRFDSVDHAQAWMNSGTRQDRLGDGRQYCDGPATQQLVGGGSMPTHSLVTVVVTHRVKSEDVDEFLAWQERMRLAESKFDGFRGTELFRPIEGVQDDWTVLYRYDDEADLEAWLTSKARRELLAEGETFQDFQSRTVDSSFGSWFAFGEDGNKAPPPSETKTSIAVWVGLYPTVVLLTLALSPFKMPLWLGLLIGNLLSSFTMSFVTMPYYVNPLLQGWLRPPPGASKASTNLRGAAVIVALLAAAAVISYLVTRVFWKLP